MAADSTPQIFVCYRRSDSRTATERILDTLRVELGSQMVFKDTESMPLGFDYRIAVRDTIQQCCVMLAVIGPSWIDVELPSGKRRLCDRNDPVRQELICAFEAGIPIIPLLVDGANIPPALSIPPKLKFIRNYTCLPIRNDPDFCNDMERLIFECRRFMGGKNADLPIPALGRDAQLPVRVLASAGFLFRGVFIQMTEGKTLRQIYEERGDYLLQCDRVIDVWCRHFGIPEED